MQKAWNDPYRKSKRYSAPIYSLEVINEHGIEIEEEAQMELYIQKTNDLWEN